MKFENYHQNCSIAYGCPVVVGFSYQVLICSMQHELHGSGGKQPEYNRGQ